MAGTPTSIASQPGESRSALKNLGDANFGRFALGLGTARNGSPVGALRAVWVEIAMPAGNGELQLSHSLGLVPDFVTLVDLRVTEAQEGTDVVVVARGARQKSWTTSTVKVWVHSAGGAAMTGAIGVFMVGAR